MKNLTMVTHDENGKTQEAIGHECPNCGNIVECQMDKIRCSCGKVKKCNEPTYVLMVFGAIMFPHPQASDKYRDKIYVDTVNRILFVDINKVDEMGERFLSENDYAYFCPALMDYEICSPNHWYLYDHSKSIVIINKQMQVVGKFPTATTNLQDKYPDAKPIKEIYNVEFVWGFYERSVDYKG